MKRLIIIMIMILSSVSFTYAYNQNNVWDSAFVPVQDQILSYIPGLGSSKDFVYQLFYPVEQWEVDVCMYGLTSEEQYSQENPSTPLEGYTNIHKNIVANLEARKTAYGNETLYEVSWYIQPKSGEIKYSVYLITNTNVIYYIPKKPTGQYKDEISDYLQGSSGYYADYLTQNFTKAILKYPAGELSVNPIPVVSGS